MRTVIGSLLQKNMNSLKMTFSKHFHDEKSPGFHDEKSLFTREKIAGKILKNPCKL